MKTNPGNVWLLRMIIIAASLAACKDKDEEIPVEPVVTHSGDKWNVTSVSYTLVDQNLTNGSQVLKIGTKANAGIFYFNAASGSFDITIEGYHKEDYFNYGENSGDVSITTVVQTAGNGTFSQHVIALSGEKASPTLMTLQGTIVKQSTMGQFSLTANFTLTKQ